MRPAIFGRRRVEQFAQRLDAIDTPPGHGDLASDDLDHEVAVARAVSARADDFAPAPATQFKQELRAVLMAAAQRNGVGATAAALDEPTTVLPLGVVRGRSRTAVRSGQRGRRTRAAVVAGLAAGTLAVSGISLASGSAMPGDTLYSVKRSGEDARLALAGSDRDRGILYLQFARTRMSEAQGGSASAQLFDVMDEDTTKATALLTNAALSQHNAALLDPLAQFVADQQRDISALGRDSATARRLVAASVDLLNQVSDQVVAVRAGIACKAPWTDAGLPLGPTVTSCP